MTKQEQFEQSIEVINPSKIKSIMETRPTQDPTVTTHERKTLILKTLKEYLTPREITVLSERFGLIDGYSKTLKEIGCDYNVSGERIRHIEAHSLRKLRHPHSINILQELMA